MDNNRWLALETSTDTLSLAISRGAKTWTHTSAGGARTSTHMIPETMALLNAAGLTLTDLQAVVFGRGPGAFTGLRTACAVAQGLALGADLLVLPIDTLLAVAEEARVSGEVPHADHGGSRVRRVLTVMDARMAQVYVAAYEYTADSAGSTTGPGDPTYTPSGVWRCVQAPELLSPEALSWPASWGADPFIAAGNAWSVYAGRWPVSLTAPQITALPTAAALLRLAPAAWANGDAVAPEHARPLYIRDKVAHTTDERLQIKAQQTALTQ